MKLFFKEQFGYVIQSPTRWIFYKRKANAKISHTVSKLNQDLFSFTICCKDSKLQKQSIRGVIKTGVLRYGANLQENTHAQV